MNRYAIRVVGGKGDSTVYRFFINGSDVGINLTLNQVRSLVPGKVFTHMEREVLPHLTGEGVYKEFEVPI